MRLPEIERGDGLLWRFLIRLISLMSGMRLPDAARIVLYHKQFYGDPASAWTHAAMRGDSAWTVGERELIAAMTAKWNACAFCIGAHSAIAARVLGKPVVTSALEDFRQAKLSAKLRSTLAFLEILAMTPDELTARDARSVLQAGITTEALEDAIAVTTLFSITVRCADTFNFAMLDDKDFDRAAKRMLVQGYALGRGKTPAHPDHRALAEVLRYHVLEGPGLTSPVLRQAMAERAAGGTPLEPLYDELARQIGEATYKVMDEQVAKVLEKAGSEKAVFELIVASAVGAGFYRWKRGLEILEPTH